MSTHFEGEDSNTLFNSLEEGGQGVFSLMVDPRQVIEVESAAAQTHADRPIRVGQELRVDIRPDSVSPRAKDVTVVWSNGFEGPSYQVRPEDVGTELFATARFAGQDMRPLEVKIECGNVMVGPPPVIEASALAVVSDEETVQALVPVEISIPVHALSAPVAKISIDWLIDGEVFATEEDVPVDEEGQGYFAQFTPLDSQGGLVLSARVTAAAVGCEDAVVTINVGIISEGREITFDSQTALNFLPPKVGQEIYIDIDPQRFDPVPQSLEIVWCIDGVELEGHEQDSFVPQPGHRGRQLSALVIASRDGYLQTAVDMTLGKVLPGAEVLNSGYKAKIKGTGLVGDKLKVRAPDWDLFDVLPDAVDYQWMRSKEPIRGATGRYYEVTAQDFGHKVWVRVFLRRFGHETAVHTSKKVKIG